MNTYAITLWDNTETEIAATPGKAKYQFFKHHEIDDSCEFGDFVKQVECHLVHKFKIEDLFTPHIEEFERMKKSRGIEFAYLGMRVEMNGKKGTIVGYYGMNLLICLDGNWWGDNCHPWWKMKYFDNDGNLIKEFTE